MPSRTLPCTSARRARAGQASVEAAFLLPVVLGILALVLQPACLLFSLAVMRSAAAESARVATTNTDTSRCREFAKRRLEGVPNVEIFHVGEWDVDVSCDGEGQATVSIQGHARPLPLIGSLARVAFPCDEQGIVLGTSVTERLRPSWVGGDYGSWVSIWG